MNTTPITESACALCGQLGHQRRHCGAEWLAMLGTVPDSEIAKLRGVSRQAISKLRRRRDIQARHDVSGGIQSRDAVGLIYFMRCGDWIKIGHTTRAAAGRLKELDCGPVPVEIVATMPGQTQRDEIAIHARFAHLRGRGEWFAASPELVSFITETAGN